MRVEKVSDVFRTTGQPSITYVERDSGSLERRLNGYLDESGQLCLITGPSKTGKTTLYKQVLLKRGDVPLVVQCTVGRTCDEIWRVALEAVNFSQITQVSTQKTTGIEVGSEVSAKFGWGWLAEVSGLLSSKASSDTSDSEIRQKINGLSL